MTPMTRRDVMKGGAAGALALYGLAPGAVLAAGAPSLFVFDARVPLSQAAARDQAAGGVPLLDPRSADLGIAWRTRIPQLVARGGAVAGLTLWSDCLISQLFAREKGLAFTFTEVPAEGPGLPLYHWIAR